MVHIHWKDRYSIGYKDIDTQHKGLLAILNHLLDLIDQGGSPEGVSRIFQSLCSYALTHFSNEERYLKAAKYPGLQRQEAEHATFIQELLAFDQAYSPSDPHLLEETRKFLQHWYINHILRTDMEYVPHLKRYYHQAPIKAVLFDFGNVICQFDNARFLEGLASLCGRPAGDLETALYQQSTLTQDYEVGRIDSAAFHRGVSALCGMDLPEEDFIRVYTDIFSPIEATFDLIKRLKTRYRIGLISNTSPWHFEHAIQTTEVFPLFDSVTLSFQAGTSKPDPGLFQDALSKLDLMAEECVYVDDMLPFAQAATEHLMHGIHYTTPQALTSQLRHAKVNC